MQTSSRWSIEVKSFSSDRGAINLSRSGECLFLEQSRHSALSGLSRFRGEADISRANRSASATTIKRKDNGYACVVRHHTMLGINGINFLSCRLALSGNHKPAVLRKARHVQNTRSALPKT